MNGHGGKLTRKQEQAIALLLEEPTQSVVAKRLGISERTLSRWLKRPDFRSAYDRAGSEMLEDAIRILKTAGRAALYALRRNLGCGVPSAEIAAAKSILEFAFRTLDRESVKKSESAGGKSMLDEIQEAVERERAIEQGHSETEIT